MTGLGPRELGDERTHCRAITAGAREHEIEALLGDRKEPQRAIARDDVDGDAEVGAALRDGRGDGVVAGGLDGVARRPRAPEEAVDQDSRAAPAVAVHHDDTGRRGHGEHGFLRGLALEARVPRPEHHPLHAPVAGDENARSRTLPQSPPASRNRSHRICSWIYQMKGIVPVVAATIDNDPSSKFPSSQAERGGRTAADDGARLARSGGETAARTDGARGGAMTKLCLQAHPSPRSSHLRR